MQLGTEWHLGHACSLRATKSFFKPDERFLICMANHIFDPSLVRKMACVPLEAGAEGAYALVETDFVGMVGVPASIIKLRLDRQNLEDVRAVQISTELMASESSDGVCAGLFACNWSVFDKVCTVARWCATGKAMHGLSGRQTPGRLWSRWVIMLRLEVRNGRAGCFA